MVISTISEHEMDSNEQLSKFKQSNFLLLSKNEFDAHNTNKKARKLSRPAAITFSC